MEKTLFSPREEHLVAGKKSLLFSKDSTKNELSCFILKHVLPISLPDKITSKFATAHTMQSDAISG